MARGVVRGGTVIVLVSLLSLPGCRREIRLEADSLLALHETTERMKRELGLSKAGSRALDNAIDVLVGDATRDLIEAQEASGAAPSAETLAAEAEALAAVHGLTLEEVLSRAVAARKSELESLAAEIGAEEAVLAEQRDHLDRIRVVRATYGMSLATRRSWIDLTVHNASDRALGGLVLDCRLIEPGRAQPREKGTCNVSFTGGLEPGATRAAQAYVGWDSEPRSSRLIEAWAIRAYGPDRAVLWQVPSDLDPREAGRMGELRTRVARVESSLRSLQVVPPTGL